MTYVGIDVEQTLRLSAELRARAASIDTVEAQVRSAEGVADIAAGATLLLDDVRNDLRMLATVVAGAAAHVASFNPMVGWWGQASTPTPRPADVPRLLADAASDTRWNAVRQPASHNTFEFDGGMSAMHAQGIRTFELDLHRGAPTDFMPAWQPSGVPFSVVADHFDHRGGRPGDWRVYHVSGSTRSEYRYLSDALDELARLDSANPITLFLDNKDQFGGAHSVDDLGELLRSKLGNRVFTPADLLDRAPGVASVAEAIAVAGWPAVGELEGRILVVVTDNVGVGDESVVGAVHFVAVTPTFAQGQHVAHPDAVVYNAHAGRITEDEIRAIQAQGFLVRTYANPSCGPDTFDPATLRVPLVRANYHGRHSDFSAESCPPSSPHPPEGTPVPIVTG